MSLDPEDDFLAAEFALGTLDPGERAALAARRQREPELDAAIADWERRLAPSGSISSAAGSKLSGMSSSEMGRARRASSSARLRAIVAIQASGEPLWGS